MNRDIRVVAAGDYGFFRSVAESVPDIVFAAAADGRAAYINEQWFRFTGRSVDDSLDLEYLASIHPEDVARLTGMWPFISESIDGRWSAEVRVRRHDGRYLWHRVSIAPLSGEYARDVPFVATITDIEGARSVERAFRTLAETVQTLVWSAQPDGTVDYFNVRWSERISEIVGLMRSGIATIVHPDDAQAYRARWKASVSSGEPFESRVRLRVRSGDYRWFELTANAERDKHGAVVRWFGTAVDIDENVALKDALRDKDATLELFRDFARRTPSLLFSIDAGGRIDLINEQWAQVLGVATGDLPGIDWQSFVAPGDLAEIRRIASEHASSGALYAGEWRIRRADDRYHWIEVRVNAQHDASGKIERWYGAALDIDSRHRATDALELLAETGRTFSTGESISELYAQVVRTSLGGIADVSLFDFCEEGKVPQRVVAGSPGFETEVAVVETFDVAVDGVATPIARAISEQRSILIEHVDDAYIAANVAPERRRLAWRTIEVRSILIVPLLVEGKSFGSITLLRLHAASRFTIQDQRVVEEIARRTAVAIENNLLREEARLLVQRREERFHRIADTIPQLMWVARDDASIEWVNERWLAFTGFSAREAIEAGWMTIVHPADRREALARWDRAVTDGSAFDCEYRLRGEDGAFRYFLGRAISVETVDGRRWYGTNTDIDEARRASRTLEVFAHVGEELSESLGLQPTLDAVMQVVVPDFADWAFIALADETGDLRMRAVYHADPKTSTELNRMIGMRYARVDAKVGSPAAMRSRQPLLYTNAKYADAAKVVEPDVLEIFWQAVGYDSVLVIPLIVKNVARGTLTVLMSKSSRVFRPADVPFFTELARRIAPAIVNAETYERERHVASTFQSAALPAHLPEVDGYVFSAVYEAGRAEALVGGDWYDAFALADGRIVIAIGDVAGSGLRAAVTMANIRQAMRGVAHVHAEPELMIEAGDRALRAENPESFATAFVGVIDPIAETVTYKSAGHSPALVALPDGTVAELRVGGLPLGLRSSDREKSFVAPLTAGSVLYLYTDGLTESTHDMIEGERRLREAIEAARDVAAPARAKAIYNSVLVDGSRDDVAILSVSVVPRKRGLRWTIDASDAAATKTARDEIMAALGLSEGKADVLRGAELVFAEIVGNLLRYAPAGAEVVLERENGRPVMHVRDRGPGFEFMPKLPPDPYSESGRGLFLISSLAADFNVTRRPDGGSHARVVFAT